MLAVTSPPRTGIRDVFPKWRGAPPGLTESDGFFDLPAVLQDVPWHTSAHSTIPDQVHWVCSEWLFPSRPRLQAVYGSENAPAVTQLGGSSVATCGDIKGESPPAPELSVNAIALPIPRTYSEYTYTVPV